MSSSLSIRVTNAEASVTSLNAKTGSYATTGSNTFTGTQTVQGTIIAQTLNVQQVTSSIVYSSGSNIFGKLTTDVQQFTGSLRVSGSGEHWIMGGNVGIGTTAPSERLQVNGKILVNNGGSLYLDSNATNTILATTGTRDLLFEVNSLNTLVVTSGGNVGIGTTSPVSKLHVAGAGNAAGGNILIGTANNSTDKWSYLISTQYNSSTHPQGFSLVGGFSSATANRVVIGGAIYEANPSTQIEFWTHTAVSHSLGGSQRMTINSNGNVGIGSTSPTTRLDVIGDTFVKGVIFAYAGSGGNQVGGITWDSTDDGILFLKSSNTTKVNINSNGVSYFNGGNVGIGTTAPSTTLTVKGTTVGAGLGKLSVYAGGDENTWNATRNEAIRIGRADIDSAYYHSIWSAAGSSENENSHWLRFYISNANGSSQTLAMTMNGNGNIGVGTTSPGTRTEIYRVEGSNRTTYTDLLTITAAATTNPYSGHGGGILFKGTTYTSGTGVRSWGRIGMQLTDFSEQTTGENMFFDVAAADNSDTLTTAMTIQYNGNVGIGTTSPAYTLDVAGSFRTSGKVRINNIAIGGTANGAYSTYSDGIIGFDNLHLSSTGSGAVYINTLLANNTYINPVGGKVGIGTSNADQYGFGGQILAVNGGTSYTNLILAGDANSGIAFGTSTGRLGQITMDSSGMSFYSQGTGNGFTMIMNRNGNLGIGTTSPSVPLQIRDSSVSSGGSAIHAYGFDGAANFYTSRGEDPYNAALYLYNNPSAGQGYGTGIIFRAKSDTTVSQIQGAIYTTWTTATDASRTSKMVFTTTNSGTSSDKVTILGNGNVGIGTTSPSAKLTIGSVTLSQSVSALDINAAGSGTYQRGIRVLNSSMGNGDGILIQAGKADNTRNAGQMVFNHVGDGSTSNYLEFGLYAVDQILNIVGTGNVGIGTIAPAFKLDVNGPINTNSYLRTTDATNGVITDVITARDTGIKLNSNAGTRPITFEINSSEKMRIHTNGFVGINTTAPDQLLRLNGTAGQPGTTGTTQNGIIDYW
jgi:hypothetical protein